MEYIYIKCEITNLMQKKNNNKYRFRYKCLIVTYLLTYTYTGT